MKYGIVTAVICAAIVLTAGISHAQPAIASDAPKPATDAAATRGLPPGAAVLRVRMPSVTAATDLDAIWKREVASQARRLRYADVYQRVLTKSEKVRATSWFRQFAEVTQAAQWLQDNLQVQAVSGTALIEVRLGDKANREYAVILTEMINLHMEQLSAIEQNRMLDRSQSLHALKVRYEIKLRDTEQELRGHLPATTRPSNPVEDRTLSVLQREADHLHAKLDQINDELDSLASANHTPPCPLAWELLPQ